MGGASTLEEAPSNPEFVKLNRVQARVMVRDGHIYFLLGQLTALGRYVLGLHHRQRLLGEDMSIRKK